MLARRHHRRVQPGGAHGAYVAHRAGVGLDAALAHERNEALVLLGGERLDRVVGQADAARHEERARAVDAQLAVDEGGIVVEQIEGDERLAVARGAVVQEGVEHLLPGRRVQLGRLREHAVEIEEAGARPRRQAEWRHAAPCVVAQDFFSSCPPKP